MTRPHTHEESAMRRNEGGYTLIELLVASLIISLAVGGLYAALYQSQSYFEAQAADVDMRQRARIALDQLVTELRHTGYSTGSIDEVLSSASDTDIEFVADIDDGDDGGPCDAALEGGDSGAERVAYSIDDSGQLLRSVDCWDGAGWVSGLAATPVLENLLDGTTVFRSVEIALEVEDSSVEQQVGEEHTNYRIDSWVRLRNTGDDS